MLTLSSAVLREGVGRAYGRATLRGFARRTVPNYADGWMPRLLTRTLTRFVERVERGESPRQMVIMPPRAGKTLHTSVLMPAWALGRRSSHHVIVSSYGLDLARRSTRDCRALVLDPERYGTLFPDMEVSKDTRAKADWATTNGGDVRGVGVGGPITGSGFSIGVCDDPVKDHREAASPAARQDRKEWWRSTFFTRRDPIAAGVLVMHTRWHEDDLAGWLLAEEGDRWDVLHLKAIATEDEHCPFTGKLLRRAGESIHPGRMPLSFLDDVKRSVGAYWWQSLYQGEPAADAGAFWPRALFRRWTAGEPTDEQRRLGWKRLPTAFSRRVISADLTFGSQSKDASYAVIHAYGEVAGPHGPELYLLEEERGRWAYPEQRDRLRAMAARHSATLVLVEKAAHGAAAIQELQGAVFGLEAVPPIGDKPSRALAARPAIEDGRYFVPWEVEQPWVVAVLDEYDGFNTAANDDRVDTDGQAIRRVCGQPFSLGISRRGTRRAA